MRRLLLSLALLALPLLARAQQPVLNIYNWADYIDPYAIERFQRETGIRVRYDVYDTLETLEGKLSAGRSGYDIVVPTSEPAFNRLVRAGALRPLDLARIPNASNLDPALMARVAGVDPGNRHGVIYLWGTVGLGMNAARIREVAPDAPMDSLQLLLNPEHARRVARCGIAVMDSAIDVLPSVLRHVGADPNSTAQADLDRALQALLAIRPHLRSIPSPPAIIDALAQGEICLAFSYSGDVIQSAARAREARRPHEVSYVMPSEGAQLWFDMVAIPADAPNTEAAHAFINFLLQPDVMAGITRQVRYPNAVPASRALLPPEIQNDRSVFPDPGALARSFVAGTPAQAGERARARLWARFKAGR
ncbi:extracellular solute-binding protein [Roseococcus sp. SYP-B2431]|uniref:extracellular solute-binding protein n=1 Tax=Roseococcus sp. SYP-B2431 TaxID=2496640 RepID=UPI0010399359|nr:extracellular solute-binding protein [Roseococcus sp. SYP-B2431]TCH96394.1 extracellular solute-binding protein [Roseococcus sp. SYP-B2431]